MLQVHFTAEDIVRLRVAAAPHPLWEITNSFQLLAAREVSPAFQEWRRLVRPRLPPICRELTALLPPRGYSPDFLTPDLGGLFELEHALGVVASTPPAVLHRDLTRLAASPYGLRPLPPWIRRMAAGDPETLRELGAALRAYHRRAIAPFWPHIRAHVDADRAMRARVVLEGGANALLGSFGPVLRWEPPVLWADYPVSRELRLYGGRGGELGALLGRRRAAILTDVVIGRTTGELASRLRISDAAASYHTAVLRRAGLLLSVRHSKHVLHTVTPAGLALLASPRGAPLHT